MDILMDEKKQQQRTNELAEMKKTRKKHREYSRMWQNRLRVVIANLSIIWSHSKHKAYNSNKKQQSIAMLWHFIMCKNGKQFSIEEFLDVQNVNLQLHHENNMKFYYK